MRTAIAILAFAALTAGEVSQEEQDRMWAEAMRASAEIKAMPATAAARGEQAEPVASAAKPRPEEELAFESAWGIRWRPLDRPGFVVREIPERMRGKLLMRISNDGWQMAGEITAQTISQDGGRGVVVATADQYDDGSISCEVPREALVWNARRAQVWLRFAQAQGYIAITTVVVGAGNGAEDLVMNKVYRLAK